MAMSAPEAAAKRAGPPRYVNVAVAGAAALAISGGGAFYFASQKPRAPGAEAASQVQIAAHGCEPNILTVPAGRRTFEILNKSDRPVEWEILSGVMVVEERENIAPGFKSTLTANLASGDYEMTCGLLSNPHGALRVTPSDAANTISAQRSLRDFLGPLAEYQFYIGLQSANLVEKAGALADAIKAGDLPAARAAYLEARSPYKSLETVSYRYSDLANKLNATSDYLAQREADPAFTGFHRLAYGLFAKNSIDGLAPVADQLVANAEDLKARLREAKFTPADLVSGAARLASQLGSSRLVSGEDAYSKTDLADIDANLDSIGKIVELIAPVIEKSDVEAAHGPQKAVADARSALERLKNGDAYPAFDSVDATTRAALAKTFGVLADAIAKLEPAADVRS